jgi:hypothetical protein
LAHIASAHGQGVWRFWHADPMRRFRNPEGRLLGCFWMRDCFWGVGSCFSASMPAALPFTRGLIGLAHVWRLMDWLDGHGRVPSSSCDGRDRDECTKHFDLLRGVWAARKPSSLVTVRPTASASLNIQLAKQFRQKPVRSIISMFCTSVRLRKWLTTRRNTAASSSIRVLSSIVVKVLRNTRQKLPRPLGAIPLDQADGIRRLNKRWWQRTIILLADVGFGLAASVA